MAMAKRASTVLAAQRQDGTGKGSARARVGADRRLIDTEVSRILVDPSVVDKAEALSTYIKHNQSNITKSKGGQSRTPSDINSIKATASDQRRRPPQFSSNFNKVKSPTSPTWKLPSAYESSRAHQHGQNLQMSGD